MNPWSVASGEAAGQQQDKAHTQPAEGRTYRAARAHPARTSEKNPGVVTKVPRFMYEHASPGTRAAMRSVIASDLVQLEEDELKSRRHGKEKCRPSEPVGPSEEEPHAGGEATAKRESKQAASTPKFTRRGNKVPEASPEGLLTSERTGTE